VGREGSAGPAGKIKKNKKKKKKKKQKKKGPPKTGIVGTKQREKKKKGKGKKPGGGRGRGLRGQGAPSSKFSSTPRRTKTLTKKTKLIAGGEKRQSGLVTVLGTRKKTKTKKKKLGGGEKRKKKQTKREKKKNTKLGGERRGGPQKKNPVLGDEGTWGNRKERKAGCIPGLGTCATLPLAKLPPHLLGGRTRKRVGECPRFTLSGENKKREGRTVMFLKLLIRTVQDTSYRS